MLDDKLFMDEVSDYVRESWFDRLQSLSQPINAAAEIIVSEAAAHVLEAHCTKAKIIFKENSVAFPDIIIKYPNRSIGIEVKTSQYKNEKWKTLGNSINGSTSVDVDEVYLLFIKYKSELIKVRWSKYTDCVDNILVTHFPRYSIDMDVEKGQGFFDKLGMTYCEFKDGDPLALYYDYLISQGEDHWFTREAVSPVIRDFSDLPPDEKTALMNRAFIHFPEILSNSNTKFKRVSKWLAAQNITSPNLRDHFTAGGKTQIEYEGETFKAPQVISKLQENLSDIFNIFEQLDPEDLIRYWPKDAANSVQNTANPQEGYVEFWCEEIFDAVSYDPTLEEYLRNITRPYLK